MFAREGAILTERSSSSGVKGTSGQEGWRLAEPWLAVQTVCFPWFTEGSDSAGASKCCETQFPLQYNTDKIEHVPCCPETWMYVMMCACTRSDCVSVDKLFPQESTQKVLPLKGLL